MKVFFNTEGAESTEKRREGEGKEIRGRLGACPNNYRSGKTT